MEAQTKQYLIVTAFGVSLFAALFNLATVLSFLGQLFRLILPIVAGAILAIFINVPMNGIKKRIERCTKKMKKQPSDKLIQVISFALALLCILLVLALVLTLLIPEIVRSVQSIYEQIKAQIPELLTLLDAHNINAAWQDELLAEINLDKVMQGISNGFDKILTNVADVFSSTVSIAATAGFAVIICVYIILGKERLCRHTPKSWCVHI